jgi:cytochrome c biogenesis protein CcmG/thiol:disulfide interchange protein DsbE
MEVNNFIHDNSEPLETTPSVLKSVVAHKKRSRKRTITTIAVVSVLNVALLVLLWTQLTTPVSQSSSSPAMVGDISSPLLGKAAPDLVLVKPNGSFGSTQKIAMSQFKGKPVILNFWATWCVPCNDEAPLLKTAVPKLQAQGVQYISINAAAESPGDIDAFNKKYGLTFPGVQDTGTGSTAVAYGVATIPVTVFINREGIIKAMWNVQLTDAGLKLELSKITS